MRFRPYDLVVVPRERLALYSEYFTVSANGVMMVRRGVQAEFVPLASWVRQASLFDLVSNIGFFKNYITGRAFRRWHKASRQSDGWQQLQRVGRGLAIYADVRGTSIGCCFAGHVPQ
jgi:dynein heavy chain